MFTMDFISARGDKMPLVNNNYFNLAGIDGLTKMETSISTSTVPSMDGDKVNNIQAVPRTIVVYLEIKGANIEDAKRYISSFVKPKAIGTLRWNQNGRTVEISGIVQAIDMPRFVKKGILQFSVYCSEPYWADMNYRVTELCNIVDKHYFPFEEGGLYFPEDGVAFGMYEDRHIENLVNEGDIASGMVITITALAETKNPVLRNVATGQYIGISDTLVAGDTVVISTKKGEKAITKNGKNIIDKLLPGSTFIQLDAGGNELMIDSDNEENYANMYFTLTYKRRYV